MARTKTLAEIRDDVVLQADLVSVGADTLITETQLTDWVINSAHRFVAMLNGPRGDRYLESTDTVNVVSGTPQYALPTDFFQLYQATAVVDGHSFPLYRATEEQIAEGEEGTWPVNRYRYRIVGGQFEIVPKPQRDFTVNLRYCPNIVAGFAVDADTINGVMGWEEWIVYDVAIRCFVKQDWDPSGLLLLKKEIAAEIAEHAAERDRGSKKVRDTYAREAYGNYEDLL